MAHTALRTMKWGCAAGTIQVKTGEALPDIEKTSQRILDRLYRRGWITDVNGNAFDRRYTTHAQSSPPKAARKGAAPKAAPVPEPPLPEKHDTRSELLKLDRRALEAVAKESGISDISVFGNKTLLVEAILQTEG